MVIKRLLLEPLYPPRTAPPWPEGQPTEPELSTHPAMTKRRVYICDWLPPDFGAVGQYAMLGAREWASEGWSVTLIGLTSGQSSRQVAEPVGEGSFEVIRVHRRSYRKQKFVARLIWTILSNILLLGAAFGAMRRAD